MGISAAEWIRRAKAISQQDLHQQVVILVERDQNQVLKKAKINELEFGYRPSFKKIGTYANPEYAAAKHAQNALAGYGYVDLIKTGAFANSLFPVQSGRGFIFDSGNSKAPKLIEAYGRDIMGLNQRTFAKVEALYYVTPIAKYIKQRLGQ